MTDTRHPEPPASEKARPLEFGLVDLAGARLGGSVMAANDEFFAPKESLLKPQPPIYLADEYTERGKWMDGWETRRRREPGHDWCLIRLGLPGIVHSVVIDTRHFVGNFPPEAALEATDLPAHPSPEELLAGDTPWRPLVARSPLGGDAEHRFGVTDRERVSHLRLSIFPDGGVARLRVYGEVTPDWARLLAAGGEVDLAALEHGGRAVQASDMFFGSANNLLLPGPPLGMHDGWETRRRRGPGNDWVIVRLGAPGRLRQAIVDTRFFKGNAPGACSLEGCRIEPGEEDLDLGSEPPGRWRPLLDSSRLQPDTVHAFEALRDRGEMTHVRLNIFPDGGVARLRLIGQPQLAR